MKIAVLSDIHSNSHALQACVNYALARDVKHFLFLGDYVSDCAYPQKTMKILYDLKDQYTCWFIKGNREEYLLDHHSGTDDGWKVPSSATGSLMYTYNNLTEDDFKFFDNLDISGRLEIEGYPPFLYCHGSLEKSRGVIAREIEEGNFDFEAIDEGLILCGHRHKQEVTTFGNKRVINVGSVGIPMEKDGDAQFGILSGNNGEWDMDLAHINYNREDAIAEFHESTLAKDSLVWNKLVTKTLRTGVDQAMDCLILAYNKCAEKEGQVDWPTISESYWQEAAREMGII
jgi:predicted phosphodiesterase